MTIEQTIEIPANHRITLEVPFEIPAGRTIVAATAIVLNAVLLTDDHHLLNLSWPGLRTQNIF
jgi:predicted nucleic acid-binding protein